jgi:hypothetical protein
MRYQQDRIRRKRDRLITTAIKALAPVSAEPIKARLASHSRLRVFSGSSVLSYHNPSKKEIRGYKTI